MRPVRDPPAVQPHSTAPAQTPTSCWVGWSTEPDPDSPLGPGDSLILSTVFRGATRVPHWLTSTTASVRLILRPPLDERCSGVANPLASGSPCRWLPPRFPEHRERWSGLWGDDVHPDRSRGSGVVGRTKVSPGSVVAGARSRPSGDGAHPRSRPGARCQQERHPDPRSPRPGLCGGAHHGAPATSSTEPTSPWHDRNHVQPR